MRRQDFNLAWYGIFVFLAVVILALVVVAIDALSQPLERGASSGPERLEGGSRPWGPP